MADKGIHTCFLDREIRMVLVGRTGVGKSETGNTICGAEKGKKIFSAFTRATSVTKKCQQHSFNRFGYDLRLVDVPGFCDTSRSDEDTRKEIVKCVGMSSPGIHAILFVVRIGRFTEDDKHALDMFLQCFGEKAKRFVIVVFTGKDDLDGEALDYYIGHCELELKTFVSGAGCRFISVNNRGMVEEKEKFTKDLIDMVKNMVGENGGQCYTDELYERSEADLREADKKKNLDEKGQKEFVEKLKQKAAAIEEQLQNQRRKMQEMEKQLGKERDEEGRLKERLKALQLILKGEEDEEAKRQSEQPDRRLK